MEGTTRFKDAPSYFVGLIIILKCWGNTLLDQASAGSRNRFAEPQTAILLLPTSFNGVHANPHVKARIVALLIFSKPKLY